MNKKWLPITAEVLDIAQGVFAILCGVLLSYLYSIFQERYDIPGEALLSGLLPIIFGVLAVVGGIFAFMRKAWFLAMAGAIIAFLLILYLFIFWLNDVNYGFYINALRIPVVILSILALFLTIQSRKQFEK